ncbi:glycosyltransferase family 4 protein [Vibrio diabolicus]|uniref:glycosyltransferase family 4 protein n=1 Tax=Vibrio diabolicus TaxID=50719 RepID=UPI002494600A|nr:glycosyltransferase family 4 protein [Vibrio diabolicus]
MSVVFIGPELKPITGQSLSFDIIINNISLNKYVIRYGGSNSFSVAISSLMVFFKLVSLLIRTNEYKVVYLTTSRTTLGFLRDSLIIIGASLFKCRVVNHLHGADFVRFRSGKNKLFIAFIDFIYRKIDTSIVLLPKMREQYSVYSDMNVEFVANTCNISVDSYASKDNKRLLFLSNVMYSKGILHLIKAVDLLNSSGYQFTLDIAGVVFGDDYLSEVEMRNRFQASICDKNYIKYHGPVTGDAKKYLLEKSAFFCLPTFYKTEALPISIIEAMKAGCIIVTSDHNYLGDIVTSSNGAVLSCCDPERIKNELLRLSENVEVMRNISTHNVLEFEREYSLQSHVRKIEYILNKEVL